ncbi:MAG: hypothetical protein LCH86_07585 [Proteobacteria bacterium]|nr:hypothetical protein [Pseudomonadota bacterium]
MKMLAASCITLVALACAQAAAILRRAYAAPLGISHRDLMRLALCAAIALGAWAVGLAAMIVEAAR